MASCIVPCCGNYFRKKQSKKDQKKISFHSLPKKSYQTWLDAIGIVGDWVWKGQRKICSIHFEAKCFDRTGQTIRLKPGAIPTLYLNYGEPPACSDQIMEYSDNPLMSQETPLFSSSPIPFSDHSSTADIKITCVKSLAPSPETAASTSPENSVTKAKLTKLIQAFHSYSCSPNKLTLTASNNAKNLVKVRKKLYIANRKITRLKLQVSSLKTQVKDLQKNNHLCTCNGTLK